MNSKNEVVEVASIKIPTQTNVLQQQTNNQAAAIIAATTTPSPTASRTDAFWL